MRLARQRSRIPPALAVLALCGGFRLPAQARDMYQTFVRRFEDSLKTADERALKRLLKSYPKEAIQYFRVQIDTYVRRGNTAAGDRVDSLKVLWRKVWHTAVLEKIEAFQSALGDEEHRLWNKLKNDRGMAWGAFETAKKSKRAEDFKVAIENMKRTAEAFENLGDNLEAAETYIYLANILNSLPQKTKADWELLFEIMDRYARLRRDWDWTKDRDYRSNIGWIKGLKKAYESGKLSSGGGQKEPAGAKKPPSQAGENYGKFLPGSKWVKVDLLISLPKKLQPGISLYASTWPLEWRAVLLEGTLPKKMPGFEDGELHLQRLGASKYAAILDPADPKTARVLKIGGGKPHAVFVPYKKEGVDYEPEYGFWFWIGGTQERVAGTSLNLAPTWGPNKRALLFYRSASVFSAKIEGVQIELYDENSNGVVGELPGKVRFGDRRFGDGFEKVSGVPVVDTMRIGRSKRLVPFTKFLKLKDRWFRLQVTGNNEELRYRELDPATVPTGRIVLGWKGPAKAKPDYLVVAETTWFRGAAFDLVGGGKKGVEVPVGEYELLCGVVRNGSPPRVMNAGIIRGKSPVIKVAAGETKTITLGAPFHLEFQVRREGGRAVVDSSTFWVKGAFGERYGAIGTEILEPELYLSKHPDGKGARKVGLWRPVQGLEINAYTDRYRSVSALTLALIPIAKESGRAPTTEIAVRTPKTGTFFLGVQQKGHKLFGKLLPVWK